MSWARAAGDAKLSCHPLLQQVFKALQIKLSQQQPERRVRRRAGDMGAEQLDEGVAMSLGESLHPHQRTLLGQDGQDRHQQHPPLQKQHHMAHAAVDQRLEKADQVGCSRLVERHSQRRKARPGKQTATADSRPRLLGQASNGPCLHILRGLHRDLHSRRLQ